nr:helix-turn-helix domain-containing protein [Frankia tisae]
MALGPRSRTRSAGGWYSRRTATAGSGSSSSPATLHRRFRTELGLTPLAWLTVERVTLACRLLERGERRLDLVACASGLGTAASPRVALRRHTGLTPTAYQRRFGPVRPSPGPTSRGDGG